MKMRGLEPMSSGRHVDPRQDFFKAQPSRRNETGEFHRPVARFIQYNAPAQSILSFAIVPDLYRSERIHWLIGVVSGPRLKFFNVLK